MSTSVEQISEWQGKSKESHVNAARIIIGFKPSCTDNKANVIFVPQSGDGLLWKILSWHLQKLFRGHPKTL
jgi:hypothetical protein